MAASSSASARRAARTAAVTRSGSGDSASAALLWTLRADPTAAESATSALSSPSSKITKTATSLESSRRGPGRPKKADANAKSAAKWDDTVTSLLLQFRYASMRAAFEGVRNNVEVGECWIQLANEISRLSGKSFDSHQCQSKLRNLKKTWREITKGTKTAAVSPLYAMLSKYLGRSDDNTAAHTAAERSDSNADASGGEHGDLRSGPAFGVSRILRRTDSASSADDGEDDGKDAVAPAGDNEEQEQERDSADEDAHSSHRADDEEASVQQQQDVTITSDARGADDGVETDAAVGHSSGARRSRSNSDDSRASKRHKHDSVPSPPSTPSLLVDTEAVVAPAVRAIASSSTDDRIDASLLSVASGLRAMVEGVVAANEATGEQTLILSELREHNALMKRYCDEVSKQTASLNALIELLAAKFSK